MRQLAHIARLVLLLLLLGLSPSRAVACCCGDGESLCDMPVELPMANEIVGQVFKAVIDQPLLMSSGALPECRPAAIVEESCPCWKPRDSGQCAAPAAILSLALLIAEPLVPTTVPRPGAIPIRSTLVELPPLRPPIELIGWSYALFPLPPPFQV